MLIEIIPAVCFVFDYRVMRSGLLILFEMLLFGKDDAV